MTLIFFTVRIDAERQKQHLPVEALYKRAIRKYLLSYQKFSTCLYTTKNL